MFPRTLSHHMDRQARTRGTVLVKSKEMAVRSSVGWGGGGGGGTLHICRAFKITSPVILTLVFLLLLNTVSDLDLCSVVSSLLPVQGK